MVYRLVHFNDKIPDIRLNIENREKQLFKPIIRIFQNTETLKEILPIISRYVSQNRELNANTLHAFLYKTIMELIHVKNNAELESNQIWDRIKANLQGDEIPNRPQSYQSVEFGEISQKGIVQILKDVFGVSKSKRHGDGRKLVFDLKKLERLGKIYDLSLDIQVVGDNKNGTHGMLGTLIGLDRHIGQETSEEGIVNNVDKKKEYDKEIILLKKQQQAEGSIADTKNVSQVSQESQTLVESGDAASASNDNASQASQSNFCNTIYRLGRSDIFACHYCNLRGDKWEMRQHPCRGSMK